MRIRLDLHEGRLAWLGLRTGSYNGAYSRNPSASLASVQYAQLAADCSIDQDQRMILSNGSRLG